MASAAAGRGNTLAPPPSRRLSAARVEKQSAVTGGSPAESVAAEVAGYGCAAGLRNPSGDFVTATDTM